MVHANNVSYGGAFGPASLLGEGELKTKVRHAGVLCMHVYVTELQ